MASISNRPVPPSPIPAAAVSALATRPESLVVLLLLDFVKPGFKRGLGHSV